MLQLVTAIQLGLIVIVADGPESLGPADPSTAFFFLFFLLLLAFSFTFRLFALLLALDLFLGCLYLSFVSMLVSLCCGVFPVHISLSFFLYKGSIWPA